MADKYPGWNPYHYVHNNPIILTDPDGMEAEDEWEIRINDNGTTTTKWISDKGGDKTDHIRVTNGIPIPQKGAIDYSYSVDVEHYGVASNNEIPLGEIESGPGYRVHDIGSSGALEDYDISDFIPTKGALKGGIKFAIVHLIKDLGEEGGEKFLKNRGKKLAKDFMKGGPQKYRDRDIFQYPKKFRRWYHKSIKKTGDPNATKKELKELFNEWKKKR